MLTAVLKCFASCDSLLSASVPSASDGNDAGPQLSAYVNDHTAFHSVSGKSSHPFIAWSDTVAIATQMNAKWCQLCSTQSRRKCI